jgi:integrase
MRSGEAKKLKWSNIDFEGQCIGSTIQKRTAYLAYGR